MSKENQGKRSSLMEDLELRFTSWFTDLPSNNRKTLIASLIFSSVLLTAAASVLDSVFSGMQWIPVIIGFPAGIAVFTLLYIWLEIYNKRITLYKSVTLHRKRIQHVLIALALLLPTLILASNTGMPYGVGGVVIIITFLSVLDLTRRTDIEYKYYITGQIDPRELKQES